MLQRILAAVDQSPRAADVVAAAAELAQPVSASVRLYRALLIPPEFPAAAANAGMDPLPKYLETSARQQLQELAAKYPDVQWEVAVEIAASAWRSILAAADAYAADLIVMGSHGHEPLDYLLGTTAARIVNLSRRDVFVVHRGSEKQ